MTNVLECFHFYCFRHFKRAEFSHYAKHPSFLKLHPLQGLKTTKDKVPSVQAKSPVFPLTFVRQGWHSTATQETLPQTAVQETHGIKSSDESSLHSSCLRCFPQRSLSLLSAARPVSRKLYFKFRWFLFFFCLFFFPPFFF